MCTDISKDDPLLDNGCCVSSDRSTMLSISPNSSDSQLGSGPGDYLRIRRSFASNYSADVWATCGVHLGDGHACTAAQYICGGQVLVVDTVVENLHQRLLTRDRFPCIGLFCTTRFLHVAAIGDINPRCSCKVVSA